MIVIEQPRQPWFPPTWDCDGRLCVEFDVNGLGYTYTDLYHNSSLADAYMGAAIAVKRIEEEACQVTKL